MVRVGRWLWVWAGSPLGGSTQSWGDWLPAEHFDAGSDETPPPPRPARTSSLTHRDPLEGGGGSFGGGADKGTRPPRHPDPPHGRDAGGGRCPPPTMAPSQARGRRPPLVVRYGRSAANSQRSTRADVVSLTEMRRAARRRWRRACRCSQRWNGQPGRQAAGRVASRCVVAVASASVCCAPVPLVSLGRSLKRSRRGSRKMADVRRAAWRGRLGRRSGPVEAVAKPVFRGRRVQRPLDVTWGK